MDKSTELLLDADLTDEECRQVLFFMSGYMADHPHWLKGLPLAIEEAKVSTKVAMP